MTDLHPLVARLKAGAPKIHTGGTITWSLADDILNFIAGVTKPGVSTLETGCGLSTLIFAAQGCRHICITPVAEEIDAIKAFAAEMDVDLSDVTFICEGSETALPKMNLPPLDLVLIDGGHGFPVPFVDWLYTAPHLKLGGLLIVDDTQIWTGQVLMEFLAAETGWKMETLVGRTAFFTKQAEHLLQDFGAQPFIQARNQITAGWQWLTAPLLGHLQAAADLLRLGEGLDEHDARNPQAIAQLREKLAQVQAGLDRLEASLPTAQKSA